MKDVLIEVAAYHNLIDVEFARMALESNGIECFVFDKSASPLIPVYTEQSPKRIVKVNQKDFVSARDILKIQQEKQYSAHHPWCPNCDSENVTKTKRNWFQNLLLVLTLGIFIVFFTERNKCNNCGHKWV